MRETIRHDHKLLLWVLVSAALFLTSIGITASALLIGVRDQQQTNRRVCVAFNRLYAVITGQLQRSQTTLPKLAYFRSHPAELRQQEQQIREQIVLFHQHKC